MKKIPFVLLIFSIATVLSVNILASPPAPTPICHIVGIIQSAEFKGAYDNPCLQDDSCPTDVQLHAPARYRLIVAIQEASYVSGETSPPCESIYPLNSEREIFIHEEDVTDDSFEENQKIEGDASSFWYESFDSYTLGDSVPQCTVDSDCGEIQECGMTWQCVEGTCYLLSLECPPPLLTECGDGACNAGENGETCPNDCPTPPPDAKPVDSGNTLVYLILGVLIGAFIVLRYKQSKK